MIEQLEQRFAQIVPAGSDFCSLRAVREDVEIVSVRDDTPEPVQALDDVGAMVTVVAGGGMGYAATPDLSTDGLAGAAARAMDWARAAAGRSVTDFAAIDMPAAQVDYVGPEDVPWPSTSLAEKFDRLRSLTGRMAASDEIVDRAASLWHTAVESVYLATGGARVRQRFSTLAPSLRAVANRRAKTQVRTHKGSRGACRQGGLEVLEQVGYDQAPERLAAEALKLLDAEDCPTDTMDVLLGPDQMILQIHESIGHPLELDRILGDERNYAGTSFVTPEMFGSYRYGSDRLNVTFDPSRPEQLVSYAVDDDGLAAEKTWIIRDGILQRPLGGTISQARAGMPGVANSRACSWNRPPIDRMANLNLEPGEASLEEMIASVEKGIYMQTNRSWSIDDSRNKFQFGCEWGRLIENGELTRLVCNPNYRGISATFWRSLRAVGSPETLDVLGTPFCGKGEPNQMVRVGHASPPALFAEVEVFGGA